MPLPKRAGGSPWMLLKRVDEGVVLSSFDGWDDLGGVAKGEGGK